jgi:D-glycero-alpha-D-manno-heptose-7-phosphate kinase
LLNALHAFANRYASADKLARESCEIEINRCGDPIGKQDQYAAAFGGLNFIQFNPDDSVHVEPIICKRETVEQLQSQALIFYTGITRRASKVLEQQQSALAGEKKKRDITKKMVELAQSLRRELQQNRGASFGEIIHEGWLLKKTLARGIASGAIDGWYEKARVAGAIGGKLLGAGAGGFLMFVAPQDKHEAIMRALKLRRMDFRFESQGSKIIFVHE